MALLFVDAGARCWDPRWGVNLLTNLIPLLETSATLHPPFQSPPLAWKSLRGEIVGTFSPPLCSSVALSIEMLLHRDFKEIDKEDAIHLVFLRQSAGEEGGEGQGMTTIHGREKWEEVGIGEGRGEGGLEKLGDGGGYKEPRG